MTSMSDWIASMSESRLNNRIEEIEKKIDWLTEEMIPIAQMMDSATENGLKARENRLKICIDKTKHRLSKLLKKKQKKETTQT